MILDRPESVGAFNALFVWMRGVGTNALAEAAQFICVGCIPCGFVFGVTAQLLVFQ